jgi:hypothetical protein
MAVKKPWLPLGLEFLSGLPEPTRKRRVLMAIQVFADESEGATPGHGRHFVMAGLIGYSEDWAVFSDEWRLALASGPRNLDYFKMKEAAGCSGQFFGWLESERDKKLIQLASIINRYAKIVTWSVIDLDAHAKVWGKLPKPQSEPYFHPYQNTILAACFALWDSGLREPFEMIFDKHLIFGPRARRWYPVIQAIGKIREPEASKILPVDPMFKDDREFLPLQAADLYAWCIRRASNEPSYTKFHWLLEHLQNVQATDYSQYYDEERMKSVNRVTMEHLRDGLPENLLQVARNVRKEE